MDALWGAVVSSKKNAEGAKSVKYDIEMDGWMDGDNGKCHVCHYVHDMYDGTPTTQRVTVNSS